MQKLLEFIILKKGLDEDFTIYLLTFQKLGEIKYLHLRLLKSNKWIFLFEVFGRY